MQSLKLSLLICAIINDSVWLLNYFDFVDYAYFPNLINISIAHSLCYFNTIDILAKYNKMITCC
jgi:hypothetical protein